MVVLFLLAVLLQEPVSGSLYGPRFLTGGVGGSITHQCFYSITPANKYDRKYWCKIAENGVCYTIISSTDFTSEEYVGRVSLQDVPQNGTFAVTMTGLQSSDTGRYRCGIGPTRGGLYASLNLTVLADAAVSRPLQLIQGELHGSVTVLCPSGHTQGGEKRFWCKVGRTSCTLIADSDGYMGRNYLGRIFITPQESSGAFKVLINDLIKEDSGLYRCGIERHSSQEVVLQVTTASALPRRPKFLTGSVRGSLSFKCHYDPKRSYEKKSLCRWEGGSCSLLLDTDGFVHESFRGRVRIAGSDPEHEICSSQDPETTTPVKPISSIPAASSTPTTGLMDVMGTVTKATTVGIVTKATSTLLPTATPGTFGTSPGGTRQESSSGESHLLPVVLPALALLISITVTVLTLVKIKLQKKMGHPCGFCFKGGERGTPGNLEATTVQAGPSPAENQTMEETPSLEKVQECKMDCGKCRKISAVLGRFRIINFYISYGEKILFKVTEEDLSQNLL
ncbi:polymeric immunoglobulin receptor-like isoform X5 [Pithys albifrons albifrons]|uniref:polymeric immunoglobulin receptor-like isoform X5 n=1 Tax=Pithys albifrons albifrons TaxID=3385563 RepID=UPI003A5CCDA1